MEDAPKPYKSQAIETPNGTFFARIYGHGPEYALAIHGFAQDGSYFETLSQQFPQLSICAVDLPWHGETTWNKETFGLRDFDPIIKFLLDEGPIHLIGFSLGARIALTLSQVHPRLTKSILLLSPDGISGPYKMLTEYVPQSWRRGIQGLLSQPDWLLDASGFLYKNGWLKKFPHYFAQKHLKNPKQRERLFRCWQSLPNFPVILGANVETPTTIIVGARDHLIRLEALRKFVQPLQQCKLTVIDRGHNLLPLPPDLGLFTTP